MLYLRRAASALIERLADEEHDDAHGDRQERAHMEHLFCIELNHLIVSV